MVDPKVSIQIAAIDAFTATINDLQKSLRGIQADMKAAGNTMSSTTGPAVKRMGDFSEATKGAGKEVTTLGGLAKEAGSMMAGMFALGSIQQFISNAMQATLAMDSIDAKLRVITGSQASAAKEMEFIGATAKRLGMDFKSTAESYSAFAVATKGTALEGDRAKDVFVALSEAGVALKLPAESLSRTFMQFQQMIAKGKVSMEDLKTASESGIVTFQQVADALGITTTELFRQMQAGELMTNDVLPKLAEYWHKTFGPEAEKAAKGTLGTMNAMKSEIFLMSAAIGKDLMPGILWFGSAMMNIIKAIIGGWQLLAVTVGYSFDYIKTKMDLTLSPAETKKRLGELTAAYDAQAKEITDKYGKAQEKIVEQEKKTTQETAAQGQMRRNNAMKTGSDLAKIQLDYAKAAGDSEMELTAVAEKEYQERVAAARAYYDQKKAASKDNGEEAAWEKVKTAKLLELQKQHARDVEIVQLQMVKVAVDLRKAGLDQEIAAIKKQAADRTITEQQAEQRITALTVAAAKDQYEVRRAIADKIGQVHGTSSEQYKAALKDQESAHKAYTDANLAAYQKYTNEIKALDQSIADFRTSIQQKIADLQQKGMTESAKYADNQKRFDEAVSKSREALANKDYETALKYNKQAEELAGRLADKKAETNTALQELESQHQKKVAEIQTAAIGQQTDQQKKSTDIAKENNEYEARKAQLLKEQAATSQGITTATGALNTVEKLGVEIMEAKKQLQIDALAKLKEIEAMPLNPKSLTINLDESALSQTKATMADLTKTETKTIVIETISPSNLGGSAKGFFTGGKVADGSTGYDSVNAVLARNEWVINNKATGFWGDGIMAAINDPLSAAGRKLQNMIAGPDLAGAGAGMPNMGTISLEMGGQSFPVSAPINVLSQLTTAVRRLKMTRPQ